jgi:hypothetical protein
VLSYSCLTGYQATIADLNTSGDPYTSNNDSILTNFTVMPNVDEIINLGSLANDRRPKGTSIHTAVGPYLNIALYQYSTHLLDLKMPLIMRRVAKPISTYHTPTVQKHPFLNVDTRIESYISVQ